LLSSWFLVPGREKCGPWSGRLPVATVCRSRSSVCSPVAVTSRRLPSWADKFRPDGPVVLSLGDGTGRDSIPLNRVTFCNALLLDLLMSNSKLSGWGQGQISRRAATRGLLAGSAMPGVY